MFSVSSVLSWFIWFSYFLFHSILLCSVSFDSPFSALIKLILLCYVLIPLIFFYSALLCGVLTNLMLFWTIYLILFFSVWLILLCSVSCDSVLFSSDSFDFFFLFCFNWFSFVPFHLILFFIWYCFFWFSSYLFHLVLLLCVLFYSISFSSALLFSETILPESYTYVFVNRLGSIMPLSNHSNQPSIHLFSPPSWAK